MNRTIRWRETALISALCGFLLLGCGKSADTTATTTPKTAAKPLPVAAVETATATLSTLPSPKSVFETNNPGKNPFFPNSAPAAQKQQPGEAPKAAAPKANLASLLQEGFQGIFGTANERMALIHNVVVEMNKETIIPMTIDGKRQDVRVRPVRILKNSVTLTVAGDSQPITLTMAQ
ncbi:MAG: hypothetical protein SFY81_09655 [Verrucomicrobiota bacterium]|nr:hypothetical protein [Verrucomicrobiota bacterium]